MKPERFADAKTTIEPYPYQEGLEIPCLIRNGFVLEMWKASWKERLQFLLTGRLWLITGVSDRGLYLTTSRKETKKFIP